MDKKEYPGYDNYEPRVMPKYKLAQAYVPYQVMGKVYNPRESLCKGTLFPELYKPYKYKKSDK